MSRLNLTVMKHLPAGFWLVVVWCALQALPLVAVSTRLEGHAAEAAMVAAVLQVCLAFGMLLRLRWVRLLLIACLAGSLFLGAVVIAVLGLLYWYVGLAHVEVFIAAAVGLYYAFLVWAFFYLFHPTLTDVFEWHWAQHVVEAKAEPAAAAQPA
jgi:hypothetical protein